VGAQKAGAQKAGVPKVGRQRVGAQKAYRNTVDPRHDKLVCFTLFAGSSQDGQIRPTLARLGQY
jgi:hypothetical protein